MKKFLSILLSCVFIFALIGCGGDSEETVTEIDSSKLTKKLKHNMPSLDLDYAKCTETVKDDNATLKIDIAYKDEMLREGVVNAITKLVEQEFVNKYKDMYLTIIQEQPHDFVKYTYNNGKWNRES
ncbi:hypothetical protein phiCTC2B_46 (endogenous virus) [Clostridium phage phiCTC2B]|uniref:Uncharacterized protein n=1 Tax=Clostridium tetani (strain Massachusetts / E88) TaxID=212717 RepID=Q892H7_CLOTE|nr:hypothetical protein [Clostridium tetani]YP_009276943.1 hypothetical protein phiCT19406B_46 [Clostridium phage phiCT19406B]YP_009277387.1 hypothetical protein phiCTC2B_46 [Clostridium phage phiCTC2B]AAO36618.1 hypothetical protein CTC_02121 [Clostridium tetani E88]AJA42803.1 hypothetical protein phiCT19406B_46 [Clostridium phage phiCT19406B]AJA42999.1 hypothetical protein phiCTC2B_46 [Clostridium phage phiCTC2B]KGI39105.1 hypothetical protein KY52_04740 [Clostridium tetani]KGI43674.1 hypo